MLNLKLTAKLAAIAVISLSTAELTSQPAFSQNSQPSTNAQPAAPAASVSASHKAAAVQLYQALELDVNELQAVAARGATNPAVIQFEEEAGRPLTESETQQMFAFWYRKFGEIISEQNIENAITSVYIENFSLEELTAINQSENPFDQISSPKISSEIEAAVTAVANPYLSDADWMGNTISEMLSELPFLLEMNLGTPTAS